MSPSDDRRLLVLGLGNLICSDDGLGVRAVSHLLSSYDIPDGVEVLDGGTLGLSLLGHVSGLRSLMLIDAVRKDAAPGTLVRLEGEEAMPAVLHRLSPHQIGVADLLNALHLLDAGPRRLVLLGLVPETIELGAELSPSVAMHMSELTGAIVEEARQQGYEFHVKRRHPSEGHGAASWRLPLGV